MMKKILCIILMAVMALAASAEQEEKKFDPQQFRRDQEAFITKEAKLTPQEADITRRGRNSQAKHAAPRHADPADYAHATALEALWGYLYLSGQTARLDELIKLALRRTEDIWQKQP